MGLSPAKWQRHTRAYDPVRKGEPAGGGAVFSSYAVALQTDAGGGREAAAPPRGMGDGVGVGGGGDNCGGGRKAASVPRRISGGGSCCKRVSLIVDVQASHDDNQPEKGKLTCSVLRRQII